MDRVSDPGTRRIQPHGCGYPGVRQIEARSICAITHTLIADAEGLYDPGTYNDRLLLGLKGTMSEAELHLMKQRLVEAVRTKARRGSFANVCRRGTTGTRRGAWRRRPTRRCARRIVAAVSPGSKNWAALHRVHCALSEQGLRVAGRRGPRRGVALGDAERGLMCAVKNPVYAGA